MGGFLCVPADGAGDFEALRRRYQSSLEAMEAKGLTLTHELRAAGFGIFVYGKLRLEANNVLQLPGGDLVVATGTLIYQRAMGAQALRRLYEDFPSDGAFLPGLHGHFAALLLRDGRLYAFTDQSGLCRIYSDPDGRVLSSSFLAVARSLPRRTLNEQGLFEYLLHGAVYGDETLLREVRMLDSRAVHQFAPEPDRIERAPVPSLLSPSMSFDEQVERVAGTLIDYFDMLHGIFGNRICTALSGGYDSRLVLGLLRRVGASPWVYVYGPPSSPDVRVARSICAAEDIPLHHEKSEPRPPDLDRFPEIVRGQYHFYDGQGTAGAFFDASDLETRHSRASHADLQLNGGGGEIYRNFWKLPDRSFEIGAFLSARYDRHDLSAFTEAFDPKAYWRRLAEHVRRALGIDGAVLSRRQIELLYPLFRLKYWMGQNNCSNNLLTYALTPFSELSIAIPSADIPLRFKNGGRFQAALIRRVDPALAAHPSVYGHDFRSPLPLTARITSAAIVHARLFTRPLFYKAREKSQTRRHPPLTVSPQQYSRVLGSGPLEIERFVALDRIPDPLVLSRALTAELLLQDRA